MFNNNVTDSVQPVNINLNAFKNSLRGWLGKPRRGGAQPA